MTLLLHIVTAHAATEELPLVHTTRCEILPHLISGHKLSGPECDVFHEHDLREIFPVLNPSSKILVMIDEAHRAQYNLLGANLARALPQATRVAYTGTPIEKTERTFGAYIDYYTMRQAQEDGVTLEIVYEGRTHSAMVSDAKAMDAKFQDVFSDYRINERLRVLSFGTRDAYLDALSTIQAKARDMVRHYARNVFPGGYRRRWWRIRASPLCGMRKHCGRPSPRKSSHCGLIIRY